MTDVTTIRGFAGELIDPGTADTTAIASSGTRWSTDGRR